MARVFIVLVAVLAVLALAEAGKVKNKKQAKVCKKNIKKFEACLKKDTSPRLGAYLVMES